MQDYEKISKEEIVNFIRTLPESRLDTRQSDVFENNAYQPSRYEFFFLNEAKKIGVKVNLVYFPSQIQDGIQSIDVISDVDNASLKDEYHHLPRPTIYNVNLTHDGIIYNLLFWSTETRNLTDDEVTTFIQESVAFYMSFEDFLFDTYKQKEEGSR